jgi:4-hydroxy-tetrahydrodipicolinate synthase
LEYKPLKGIFPYLVSPIDESSGRIREVVLRNLVENLIAQGVHGLSPLGSTGEFAYLTFEQRREIVRIVVDAAAGRVPVVPGVAAYATEEGVRQAQCFAELGAEGIILIHQILFPVSKQGVESYFLSVASSVECPVVVYSNPGLLGGDIGPDLLERLSEESLNIRYVKDASGNTGRLLSILNRIGDRVGVFSASAHVPLLVFQLGGIGWMAGPACVAPSQCVALYNLAQRREWEKGMALQKRLWALNELFQKYALAACIKTALQLQGWDVGNPIRPQEPLPAPAVGEIKSVLEDLERMEAWD